MSGFSSKIKRYYGQSRMDLSGEQHTPEPERNSNSNSHNSTSNNTSRSHNFSPVFISFPYVDHEQTEPLAGPSTRPILEGLSKQLEAIRSQIRVPEAETEAEDNLSDSDEMPPPIPSAPPLFPHPSRPRQRMSVRDSPQTPRTKTVRPEFSAKRKGKRRQDALKPPEPEVPEAETEAEDNLGDSDKMPPIPSAPPIFPHSSRPRDSYRTTTSTPEFSAKRKGKRRQDALKPPEPEPENDRLVVDDRTRKQKETTDNFFYFLYFLAVCALIFFLMFLFLLSVLFLFCLYVFHFSYK